MADGRLNHPDIDEATLRAMATSSVEAYRIAAAHHPDTPDDVLAYLIDREVRAWRSKTPPQSPERGDYPATQVIARRENLAAEVVEELLNHPHDVMSWFALHQPAASPDQLRRWASEADHHHLPRGFIANNPSCPADALDLLADDDWASVREKVARHPNTGADTLARLAEAPESEVRAGVAANPNTPVPVLVDLGSSDEPDVCEALAGNPNTPTDILDRLASSSHRKVRAAVASNPSASTEARSLAALGM